MPRIERRHKRLWSLASFFFAIATVIFVAHASASEPGGVCDGGAARQCVSQISYVDPSSITAVQNADGSVSGGWDPAKIATTETLPAPVPLDTAVALAASRAAAHGLEMAVPLVAATSASKRKSVRGRASQWGSGDACSYTIYSVWLVWLDSYNAHAHAKSQQYCNTSVSSHGVTHWIARDSLAFPGDSDANLGGGWAIAESYANCHSAGDHWWYNFSSLWANKGNGVIQGPSGYFNPLIKRCY